MPVCQLYFADYWNTLLAYFSDQFIFFWNTWTFNHFIVTQDILLINLPFEMTNIGFSKLITRTFFQRTLILYHYFIPPFFIQQSCSFFVFATTHYSCFFVLI